MQAGQLIQEFPRIQQCIQNVAQLCQQSDNLPEPLKRSVGEMQQESEHVQQILGQQIRGQQPADGQIVECIDRLESLSDQAMQACRQGGNVGDQMKDAIQQAHDSLSNLKHQLH